MTETQPTIPGSEHRPSGAYRPTPSKPATLNPKLPQPAPKPAEEAKEESTPPLGISPDWPKEVQDAARNMFDHLRANYVFSRDKSDYWRRTKDNTFARTPQEDLKRHLRKEGFPVMAQLVPGQIGSARLFDEAIVFLQDHSFVTTVFNLSGHRPGILRTREGKGVLIPDGMRPMKSSPGDCGETLHFLFDLLGESQLPYFLAWMKSAVEDYSSGNPDGWRSSHMLGLVGPAGCGKSMLQNLISEWIGGGEADPYDMLIGSDRGRFTQDLANAAHWRMEDKAPIHKISQRMHYSENVKHHCVTRVLDVHAKGRDKIHLPTFRRITISCNEESDAQTNLPFLTEGIRDKLIILQCSKVETLTADYHANITRFRNEMSAFRHYLLKEHVVSQELKQGGERMGFREYINPDIEQAMKDANPVKRFEELFDLIFFPPGRDEAGPIRKTAAQIQQQMTSHEQYGRLAQQILPSSNACGSFIRTLKQEKPQRFRMTNPKGITHWTISPP